MCKFNKDGSFLQNSELTRGGGVNIIQRGTRFEGFLKQRYGYHSVSVGMAGKYRTDKQTGMVNPPIPPRVKFRTILGYFGCFGSFRYIPAEI